MMAFSFDALLLFCHGARAPSWRAPFDALRADLEQCWKETTANSALAPIKGVELAFLEFMEPNFATSVDRLYALGARHIGVSLLFLAAGGHTVNDVDALVEQAKAKHPDLRLDVSETLLSSAAVRAAVLKELVSGGLAYSPR